jgi:hypothetical protein|nr:MAG TPA: protein of unknown function (DUF4376) [Caudoviricetes sp.]
MKVNFVKTFIPVKDFVKIEKVGNKILVRFDAVMDTSMNAYSCVEGSVLTSEYNEQELQREYEAWKQKWSERALELAKKAKIAEITDYDTSDKVNGFILNGLLVWLDKATRVGLMNSTTIAKAAGQKTTTLWLGGVKLAVDCDKAIQLLSALEMYALECFNVTASHKAAVSELTTIEEVEAYDYKSGYPKMLEMSV